MEQRRIIRQNGRPLGQALPLVGATGKQRERNLAPPKPRRYREAIEIADLVRDYLDHRFPDVDWSAQVVDGVEAFVQRCLEQFGSTPRPTNASAIRSGEDYMHYARSAEEIKATMAAEEGVVSKAPRNLPRYRQAPEEVEIPESELAMPGQPPPPPPPSKGKWNL